MIAHVVHKRAGKHLKERYLERLIAGEIIGAFCLSEPNIGSDAKSVETTATLKGDSYVLNGSKKWITFGQVADLLLVFAQCDGKPTAFLVDGDTPGLTREPISGMLGSRASMLAELRFENCEIPRSNMLGGIGFGLATIATAALDIGRYTVAWGSVGIGQACLEASVRYSSERKQFGVPLREHQLISQMVCDMLTNVRAARLLCLRAGYTKDINDPSTVMETWVAKYFASTTAVKAALDAVQIHGANGCSGDYPVQRYLRDAKIMEIIEGSTQLQQVMISRSAYQS
jgi:alkylation response protein AidB-like acyl-CoA dehydrogenase